MEYPEQSKSMYVVPWKIGEKFRVSQGNNTELSHRAEWNQEFAYDFALPMGAKIVATRAGTVIHVKDSNKDNTGKPREENSVSIQHSDGTVAQYIHIQHKGALVTHNQLVSQGDEIALSGNSGNSDGPHLHFHVLEGYCPLHDTSCKTIPVNFKNTDSPQEGLEENEIYTARNY